ncbi:cAMP-binding protein - catabolite gene activator and regulatory subunit of cAMP-dependent protein kinase [Serpentinimonas raichei]|uniref:cAMP-binding protein-catabolite gene activator and regulatory subunit of cAMP-dependent protein kinase n=1 Tax=Serpentinimonas raichei TaxID=1458425 RepID=A0A060NI83_9BURK|nr:MULTISPECIES: cyclic nucleotide-binding domain-containing protein [Serpentinimonas]BAO80992.1 cAMP-binding protein - catabolite gene activator and regulatory subunit of cAMP-dependent protein kinase [Serpentinimonas raichei]
MQEREVERIANLIYQAPLGEYIGRDGAAIMAAHAGSELRVKDQEFLFHQGDMTNSFYIVTEGRLGLVREKTETRREITVHVLEKGDLVGELSFIDQTPHDLSVRALGNAAVLCFKAGDIQPLITQHPQLVYNFMRAVVKRVHAVVTTLAEHEMELQQYIQTGGRGRM